MEHVFLGIFSPSPFVEPLYVKYLFCCLTRTPFQGCTEQLDGQVAYHMWRPVFRALVQEHSEKEEALGSFLVQRLKPMFPRIETILPVLNTVLGYDFGPQGRENSC